MSFRRPIGTQQIRCWVLCLAVFVGIARSVDAQVNAEGALHLEPSETPLLHTEELPAPLEDPQQEASHRGHANTFGTPLAPHHDNWHWFRPPLPTTFQQAIGGWLHKEGGFLRNRYWANADLLYWWGKQMNTPELVANGDGDVLFGRGRVGDSSQTGVRLNIGYWLAPKKAIGASFFTLGQRSANFDSSQTGESTVVRPFLDDSAPPSIPPVPPVPSVLVVNSADGNVNGNVAVDINSDVLEANFFYRRNVWCEGPTTVDLLAGYQLARINEELTIRHRFVSGGVLFDAADHFDTKNEFHGAALGVLVQHRCCRWRVDLLARLGLGNMRGTVSVSGTEPAAGLDEPSNQSLLARLSNVGRRTENQFAAVRELGINWVYHWNRSTDLVAGYSFIYFKHVLQPGDQIDLVLPDPQPLMNDSSYWLHGMNFGIQRRF